MPSGAILVSAAIAWLCAAILILAAYRKPRVGALVERAVIAAALALFGTVYGLVATHTDLGLAILDTEAAKTIIRTGVVILVGVLPLVWVVLWATGNLGEGADASVARIEDAIAENTRISQAASDHADAAYKEANSVNEKIANQGAVLVAQGEAAVDDRERIVRIEDVSTDTNHRAMDIQDRITK